MKIKLRFPKEHFHEWQYYPNYSQGPSYPRYPMEEYRIYPPCKY